MTRTLTLVLALAVSALAIASEPDFSGRYHLTGPAWNGAEDEPDIEVLLTVQREADGSYAVAHQRIDTQETLRGTGRFDSRGRELRVTFEIPSGVADQLQQLLGGQGQGGALELEAAYRFGPVVTGLLRVEDASGRRRLLHEQGRPFESAGADTAKAKVAPGGASLLAPGPGSMIPGQPPTQPPALIQIPFSSGALEIPDRPIFEALSRRDNVPGAMGVREVKFLVVDVDTPNPTLYFVNTKTHTYHYDFATQGLGLSLSLQEFNGRTYFTQNRSFLAGSIIAHDSYEAADGSRGVYTVEFWPTDPVQAAHVAVAFHAVRDGMPFTSSRVRYHPASESQRTIYADQRADFDARGVVAIDTDDLFASVTYSPLNLGEGYGVLRLMDGSDARPPSVRDVVIFVTIPNDLSHVAGVITEAPQTPLSHINLKAKQNDTPNAYVKDASQRPEVQALLGKLVRFEVTPDGFELEQATQAEADAYLENMRPQDPQAPARDLSVTEIRPVRELRNADTISVGAKAANLGELHRIMPAGVVPDGYAVPFSFYHRFMEANGLYDRARDLIDDPDFQADPAVRAEALRRFRRRIRRGTMPPDLLDALGELQGWFPAGQALRCRSSTNNEDLEGFNGAGLYDSNTHRPNEGHLERTIKQVWRSLWNYRAFEEREFYRIDHFSAAMGVLVHPNFDDELANGVAVTKNIYDPNWPGFYVNVQVGESLVTNPDAGATPDELLIAKLGQNLEYEVQYIQHSTLLPDGQATVLSEDETTALRGHMERIQRHFQRVYDKTGDPTFAMDIEFKITASGELIIKQARPWVD